MYPLIKKLVPNWALNRLRKIILNRPINNVFKRINGDKRVLISYITSPFRLQRRTHTNHLEVLTAAKIFDELGFVVDVIHYEERAPRLDKYDVIYGFGHVFQKYFEQPHDSCTTIYYGAGMHVNHQNTASLKRIKDVYKRKGAWMLTSSRLAEYTWSHQTSLVDGIIALGDHTCAETYEQHYDGHVLSVPAPFYEVWPFEEILTTRDKNASRRYLWFGGAGAVHKGLDLCLEFFSKQTELELYICGNLSGEKDFVRHFHKELFETENIKYFGFIEIDSIEYKDVLSSCAFVIFPSCSEGGGPSVVTAIGNGALIPLLSRYTSIAVNYKIEIATLDFHGVENAVQASQDLTNSEIIHNQRANAEYVLQHNSCLSYQKNLEQAINAILDNN